MSNKDKSHSRVKDNMVFRAMRSNLALSSSFIKNVYVENDPEVNIGFISTSTVHTETYNNLVFLITMSLIYQAFDTYVELKQGNNNLIDPDIEGFLNEYDSKKKLIKSMKIIRNSVFHIQAKLNIFPKTLLLFSEAKNVRFVFDLHKLLYDFTDKVFSNKLKLYPQVVYDECEKDKAEAKRLGITENEVLSKKFDDLFKRWDRASECCRNGMRKLNLNQLDRAIFDFDKSIEFYPNAEAYFNRSIAKYKLGKKRESIADFNKAKKLNPKCGNLYTTLKNTK